MFRKNNDVMGLFGITFSNFNLDDDHTKKIQMTNLVEKRDW